MDVHFDVILSHCKCFDGYLAAYQFWKRLPPVTRLSLSDFGGFYGLPRDQPELDSDLSSLEFERAPVISFGDYLPLEELSPNSLTDFSPSSPSSSNPSSSLSNIRSKYVHPNSVTGGLKLQEQGFSTVFVFIHHTCKLPQKLYLGKRVAILDLDLGPKQLGDIVNAASHVTLIDHHASSYGTLNTVHNGVPLFRNPKLFIVHDSGGKECAATLTWKLFNGTTPPPPMYDYVCAHDNRLDHLTDRRAVISSLHHYRTFRSFDDIENTLDNWDTLISQFRVYGETIKPYQEMIVDIAAKKVYLGFIRTKDGKVYTVAYNSSPVLANEIAMALKSYAQGRFRRPIDFTAMWEYHPHLDTVTVSLRDPRAGLNLEKVAQEIEGTVGGGGHAKAAAFAFTGLANFHNFIAKDLKEIRGPRVLKVNSR